MQAYHYLQEMIRLALDGEMQGVTFLIALYLLVVCGYSLVYQIRINRWPAVAGRLLDLGVKRFGVREARKDEQNYVAGALYRYAVDGKTYEGRRVSPWQLLATTNLRMLLRKQIELVESSPEGSVQVFYNPAKPHKSYLIKTGLKSQLFTAMLAFGPALAHYAKY